MRSTLSGEPPAPIKGRGATFNPGNRFRRDTREAVDDGWTPPDSEDEDAPPPLKTTVTLQRSRTIIARNDSPDIPFTQSINPYQGCEHGCVYCYARPTHAYLDLSPGLDFETKLFAKPDAAKMLEAELAKPGYVCDAIAMGTNTDPYQPIEREWKITRQILEVLAACEHPVSIVTKSALVERDIDILAPMAAKNLARVYVSVTTLDRELARKLEPRAAAPQRRLAAIKALADAGIPVGVMTAPIIPQLTDKDMEAILEAAAANGARLRRLDDAAAAVRGEDAVSRLARAALPVARRARDEHRAADPRRARQRSGVRLAHARAGTIRRADRPPLRHRRAPTRAQPRARADGHLALQAAGQRRAARATDAVLI